MFRAIRKFEKPECEAFDIFVNEVLCVGCPYSCVKRALHSFSFASTGSARFTSILSMPYNSSAEAELLYSFMVKAKFENNQYLKPKKQPKTSTQHVDWF
ncbi:hypothetical protein RGQ29_014122 [Quercus rubra]|uniref:Uncharacterized protein n=1 Tax=Quercus rubra TaxID=3512 RepID=A0AAN7FL24_QUERU|nr:hypothetical protein RGQ29_014122 [Quercus rubra]